MSYTEIWSTLIGQVLNINFDNGDDDYDENDATEYSRMLL